VPAAVGWRALEGLRRRKSKGGGGGGESGVPENPRAGPGGEELQLSDSSSRGKLDQTTITSRQLGVASWGKAGNVS